VNSSITLSEFGRLHHVRTTERARLRIVRQDNRRYRGKTSSSSKILDGESLRRVRRKVVRYRPYALKWNEAAAVTTRPSPFDHLLH
jgi:hypothetical protein